MEKSFLLEPKWQKCITQVEFWKKGDLIIERAQLWRFGEVTVFAASKSQVSEILEKRDGQDRICISDAFEYEDDTLRDCISDDLYFPDEIPEAEQKRLSKLFADDPEDMFENENWEIIETKLYFEGEVLIK